jgi:hypothetical protein
LSLRSARTTTPSTISHVKSQEKRHRKLILINCFPQIE